ncbi:MAG: HNH endonuclease [Bacillota bacterium]
MKFELNEDHRNISDEDLLEDLKRVLTAHSKKKNTKEQYIEHGKFSASTLERRFGGWSKCLRLIDCKSGNRLDISEDELIDDVKSVAALIGKDTVTTGDYHKYGKFGRSTIFNRFGLWSKCLEVAGLNPTGNNRNITNEDLFEDIENTWIKLGRQPTTTDIINNFSKYSRFTFSRRFGSWRKALEAFVKYINSDEESDASDRANKTDSVSIQSFPEEAVARHKSKRDINLRMRFIIMSRDKFKCRVCGASPATEPKTILHVDHIVPWSKGGETELENLQTLCSKCNLGKGDYVCDI